MYKFAFSWFLETVQVYSPFVMVQLIYCTIEMAIIAYFLDLVNSYYQGLLFILFDFILQFIVTKEA